MTKRFESFDLNSDSGVFMLDPAQRELLGNLADQATEDASAVDQNARFLELARSLPTVRLDQVMKVRDEIAAGTSVLYHRRLGRIGCERCQGSAVATAAA